MKKLITGAVIFILFLFDLITGRAIMNGLDSLIPRPTTALETPYTIELIVGGDKHTHTLWCEHYYDAQGGSRGNYWSIREKGRRSGEEVTRIKTEVQGVGTVSFVLPSCLELSNGKQFTLGQMIILVNGHIYGHQKGVDGIHTFIPRLAHLGEPVEIPLSLKIDGREIP